MTALLTLNKGSSVIMLYGNKSNKATDKSSGKN